MRLGRIRRGLVPEGLNESSPVRSAGESLNKAPVRTGRSIAALARGVAWTESRAFRTSLAGRTRLLHHFPSTSYWATIIESLRDKSSSHSLKPYVDAWAKAWAMLCQMAPMTLRPWEWTSISTRRNVDFPVKYRDGGGKSSYSPSAYC